MDLLGTRALRGWTVASLLGNMTLIVTGALVRLTGSGLGCPTWPQCTAESFVPHPELGIHGAIEFGNRLLTFVLAAIALMTFLAALRAVRAGRAPSELIPLSLAAGIGIPLQGVIGGLSVLTQLNPWVVGLHLVLSIVLVFACVWMIQLAWGIKPAELSRLGHLLVTAVFWLGLVVLALGVVTTGSGPNSGDGAARRNGFDMDLTAKLHAWAVWALVIVTVIALVVLWRTQVRTAVVAVLAIEVLQGVVGYVQYFTGLPLGVVITHMLGTAVFSVVLAHLYLLARRQPAQNSSGSIAAAAKTSAR